MEKLESIVGKVIGTGIVLGTLYLGVMSLLGGYEVREAIADATKMVMVAGPAGDAVGAQILTGNVDPSVQKWLDYTPHKGSYTPQ